MLRSMACASTSGREAASVRPPMRISVAAPPARGAARLRLAPVTLASPPQRANGGGGGPGASNPDASSAKAPAAVATSAAEGVSSVPAIPPAVPAASPSPMKGRAAEARATQRTIEWQASWPSAAPRAPPLPASALEDAYTSCGAITADYAKTFYLGTKLMTPAKARAIWAIYVWCRRTDELVDGPNAPRMTPAALDRWEERLEGLFEGRPYDILDAALTDTVSRFAVDIQPFRDMIDGMRMDLTKARYATYDELYDYCYKVAGTVGLMTTPVMGVDPLYTGPPAGVLKAALALGTANQLTNILRDVGEDAVQRNRVYVPLEDLARFGIGEAEVARGTLVSASTGAVDPRWAEFMRFQIARARACFADAEAGVGALAPDARWPVWSALILYRQILDAIEANGYDNFTRRAYVPKWRKYASLPAAALAAARPAGMVGKEVAVARR